MQKIRFNPYVVISKIRLHTKVEDLWKSLKLDTARLPFQMFFRL